MLKRLTIGLLLVSLCTSAQTELLKFDIIHQGKTLGTLIATKTIQDNQVHYTSKTNIQYDLLVDINIQYNYKVAFVNKELKEASAHIVVRGKDKTDVKTLRQGKQYMFYSDNKAQKTINQNINHSIVQLLFEEPIGVKQVYAEEHGEFHNIVATGPNAYTKTKPNGKTNTYLYQNGKLQQSTVDAGIIKFAIVKAN